MLKIIIVILIIICLLVIFSTSIENFDGKRYRPYDFWDSKNSNNYDRDMDKALLTDYYDFSKKKRIDDYGR
jgi:hypothetical protein